MSIENFSYSNNQKDTKKEKPETITEKEAKKILLEPYQESEYLRMKENQEGPFTIIATDIDNTFYREDRREASQELKKIAESENCPIVAVTGNDFQGIKRRIDQGELPYFQIISGSVGTEIWILKEDPEGNKEYVKDENFEEILKASGFQRKEISKKAMDLVEKFRETYPDANFDFQNPEKEKEYCEDKTEDVQPFKISFYFFASDLKRLEETCDMSDKIIDKYQLGFVNHVIDWPEGKNLPGDNIYQKMREAEKKGIKKMPKTSQASPKAFRDSFQEEFKKLPKNAEVISILLSSKLSGAFNSANQAKQMMPNPAKVFIFDSLNVSSGLALFILRAIELKGEKRDLGEIIKKLKRLIPNVYLYGALEDPKWLESGGRMSHSQAVWVRRIQKIGIRPLISVKNGKIEKGGICFGAKDLSTAVFKKIKKTSRKARSSGKKIMVVINHCDNKEEAEKLRKKLKEIKAEVPYMNLVSPVIGVHVGPGTLTAAWTTID